MINVIHIFGASGSGTTTIAQAIQRTYGHVHLDTDNYFWILTDPPYKIKRTPVERQRLLKMDITKNEKSVISGSLCGRGDSWGDIFIPLFNLAIFIDTPTEVRIKRLEKREFSQFGSRILPGGDMYDKHREFIEWAKTYDTAGIEQRSRALHMKWMKNLVCSIVTVDGTLPIGCILSQISEKISK